MLTQTCLYLPTMVERAVRLLRDNEPPDGYYGCFSGGKDSVVTKRLTEMAEVRVDWHYSQCPDPPELIQFIRREHPNVVRVRPRHGNFFRRMEHKGFPTRKNRWCCNEYKETSAPEGSHLILGIRAQESWERAGRWSDVSYHRRTKRPAVLPIFRWDDSEVWQFIQDEEIPYCGLYDEGFTRLGCVGCPMGTQRGKLKAFARWPRYERLWRRSFMRIWERRSGTVHKDKPWFGNVYFRAWEEMWEWWLLEGDLPERQVEDGELWRG